MSVSPRNNAVGEIQTITENVSQDPHANSPEPKGPGGLGIRHLETFLMFLGLTTAYMLRVNMSVAIVAMSDSSTANVEFEDFGWDISTQSIILSSFFWGYVITQIPSGQLAHTWSASKLWALSMFVCGVVNLLIPIAARIGDWQAVCACRIIMGLSQGCVLPCVHTLLGKWVPPSERGRLGTYSYSGAQFGTVIGLPISGWISASSVGWPSVFYLVGILTIVWSVIFFIWGSDSPALHRSIKPAEQKYIEESLGQIDAQKRPPTPWMKIVTSIPVWSLIIVHCGQNWGYWTLLTEMPSYMNSILLFNISKNGLTSALPYLAMWLLSFPASWASDYILKRGLVTRAVSRKILNSIGHWGPGIALIALGYVTADHSTLAVIVLIFAVGLNAGSLCGFQINHIDLSPNFAGTLMSITNCIANVMSILAPLICGLIVTDSGDISQWRTVFWISAAIYFLCNLVFVLFGQGEVQEWNETNPQPNTELGKSVNRKNESEKKSIDGA